jgi:2-amino-4-hydroxy-6-hydroxymethyldihydropteridine diphosphokinase
MTTAYIAFGGNVGDVPRSFREAREELAAVPGCRLVASSLSYVSPPLGPPAQPDYHNAVVSIVTELLPRTLLHELERIETRHGRKRGDVRWGPRTLDLDLIAMDDMVLDAAELTLPHPEMHARVFVLQPLCDLAPEWQHPRMGQTARELLESCIRSGQRLLENGVAW